MSQWINILDSRPEHGQDCLYYYRGVMGVGRAEIFSQMTRWWQDPNVELTELDEIKYQQEDAENIGRFKEFGKSYYFDNENLYWMPVPLPPKKGGENV
jgi:hypothetical protein